MAHHHSRSIAYLERHGATMHVTRGYGIDGDLLMACASNSYEEVRLRLRMGADPVSNL